jgi:TRAP-type C4-dicarboxylate transport system permease large subunit
MPSLIVVTLVSLLAGQLIARRTSYTGMDFAVVSMAAGIATALLIALLNRVFVAGGSRAFLSPLAERVTFVMVPPLLLIFLVLGTILIGLATPTEGGAMGAVGAMLLAAAKRRVDGSPARFNIEIVRSAAEATVKLSAFVLFILIGARIFSLTFYGVNGHLWVEHLLTSLPGGMYGFLALVMIAVFLLAFFLDFFELAFIIVPLLKPAAQSIFTNAPEAVSIAKALGLAVATTADPDGTTREIVRDVEPFMIWFGVLLAVNMQTSFMHPPFGFALFYLRSVAPKTPYADRITGRTIQPVTSGQIYWGAVPYVGLQLLMVALVMLAPSLVMHAIVRPTADAGGAAQSRNVGPSLPSDGRFALPPSPPAIPGGPPPAAGPGAPTLDMRQLPNFEPRRTQPEH